MPITAKRKTAGGPFAPAVADHFSRVLLAIYHWRYVRADDVQRLFPDDYRTTTPRTARHHLQQLELLGYLKATRPTRIDAKVYSVTAKARRHLGRQHPKQPFLDTREETIRPDLIRHELSITDIQSRIHLAALTHPELTTIDNNRRYFHHRHLMLYRVKGTVKRLEPDLGVTIRIDSKPTPFSLLHFVESDLGTESPTAFRKKMLGYQHWYEQVGERALAEHYHGKQTEVHTTFRLLVVTRAYRNGTDSDRLQYLYDQAQDIDVLKRRTFFTTNQALQNTNILTSPIWFKLRQMPPSNPSWLFR